MAACERCPSPGACASCPAVASLRRLQTVEFGKNTQIVSTLKEISSEFKGISYLRPDFSSARLVGGEAPTPINKFVSNEIKKDEKACSECGQSASTCRCDSKAA